MFKYPLAVTIDTNIFDAAKFDLCDTSPLKTLENYVKNGKIKVVLSDIVVKNWIISFMLKIVLLKKTLVLLRLSAKP
jgi:hypothetical protein